MARLIEPGLSAILSSLILIVLWQSCHASDNTIIKVLILATDKPVTIRGSNISLRSLKKAPPLKGKIRWEKYRRNDQWKLPVNLITERGPIIVAPGSGEADVNDRHFRGKLELRSATNGTILVINRIPLEDYLPGIIEAEIPARWPLEAKKAQAVAARTYALWKMGNSVNPYHLVAGVQDQAYLSRTEHDHAAIRAVRETEGIYMARSQKPILAYYHSCCGGRTDSARAIKGRDLDYISPVDCPWCKAAPRFNWEYKIPVKELVEKLNNAGYIIDKLDALNPVGATPGNRVAELELITPDATHFINAEELRKILGYRELRSAKFKVEIENGYCKFTGTGYGHGLGACQYGMKGMADAGKTWKQMLRFYYKGVEFRDNCLR